MLRAVPYPGLSLRIRFSMGDDEVQDRFGDPSDDKSGKAGRMCKRVGGDFADKTVCVMMR